MGKTNRRSLRVYLWLALVVGLGLLCLFLSSRHYAILDPKGVIAHQQRNLLFFGTALSLLIIIPVFVLTYHIVHTYRVDAKPKGRKRPVYTSDWDGSRRLETIWWGVPAGLILILSIVTWNSSHALDPYKPIVSDKPPLIIQVVALQWKWLFIYPEYKLATVNYMPLPVGRPVSLQITADAPMNSLWIPQLAGQVYAMNGMTTQLHLMATQAGSYRGSSANISGEGFAGMHFQAHALKESSFNLWATVRSHSQPPLTAQGYDQLSQPSSDTAPASYALGDDQMYTKVIDKYMSHGSHQPDMQKGSDAANNQ